MTPDEIVITSGAKEAVYLSVRAVTRPGDTVAIECPAYYALLEVLASLDLRPVEIPTHPRDGIDLDHLERVLRRQRVAAVALVSNFSNPTGSCMTDDAKRRLVDLLEAHDVPLIEDDVYGDLAFDGAGPKAVKAFDRSGLVLYCGSYSKTLSPGLRVGWAIPGRHQNRVRAPEARRQPGHGDGAPARHRRVPRERRLRPPPPSCPARYREQMERMIEAVERHFPASTRHTTPRGGHVLWVQLPAGVDAMELYEDAGRQGIQLAPGPMFSPSGGYRDYFRLNTGFPFSPRPSARSQPSAGSSPTGLD